MKEPRVFLAYAPRGAGLRCALAYLADQRDVYGWFTGPRHDASQASSYFLLEKFYSSQPAAYAEVDALDLRSQWPLDEERRQQLARMQEMFSREWLVYRDDPRAPAELQAYAEAELAAGEVNVRFERLARFSTAQPNWTFFSPGFERPVLKQLAKRWPLEFQLHAEFAAAPRRRGARSCP